MSIFKAFFGLGKIPQVVKFFEFKSFDDVNKMGGAIAQIKQQVREGGLQLTQAQQKFLDDQMKQVEMVFEKIQQPTKETGIKSTQSAKIFDLQGQEIPQGSKIMGGKQSETEAEIAERLGRENKKAVGNIRKKKLRDEISKLDDKIEARKLQLEQRGIEDFETDSLFNKLDEQRNDLELKLDFEDMVDPEDFAQGGRAGFKDGMSRRKFMQIMGGLAAIPIVGKFFKLGKVATKAAPIVKTPPVPGKPEWFDALVNKVIAEGEDVTKQFATKEREIVHRVNLEGTADKTKKFETYDDSVYVYRDLDDGTVRVEYNSLDNMSEAPVNLTFKPGMADEATKGKPADTFQADEIVPESRMVGPDDFEIEDAVDEFDNVVDLNSDVSKLKQFAGEKLTTKEIVEGINKRKRSRAIVEDSSEAADFMTSRQGDYDPSPDDFASGGIARMLGE